MKAIILLLLFSLSAQEARASGILQFSARIESELLAEEAIDLLHCLSEGTGIPWELSEGKGPHRLVLAEKSGHLEGTYRDGGDEQAVRLGRGEAQSLCESLLPEEEMEEKESSPHFPERPEVPSPRPSWILLGAAALATLAGGFLLLRKRESHGGIRME